MIALLCVTSKSIYSEVLLKPTFHTVSVYQTTSWLKRFVVETTVFVTKCFQFAKRSSEPAAASSKINTRRELHAAAVTRAYFSKSPAGNATSRLWQLIDEFVERFLRIVTGTVAREINISRE